jgi:uncharacterized membrane protein
MSRSAPSLSDQKLERILGNLLRAGVMVSGAVVFNGEPSELRHVSRIVSEALALQGRGLIQFGLLLLVATPVARVLFSLVGFAIQRDRTYVAVTLIVLAVLIYGLSGGPR